MGACFKIVKSGVKVYHCAVVKASFCLLTGYANATRKKLFYSFYSVANEALGAIEKTTNLYQETKWVSL